VTSEDYNDKARFLLGLYTEAYARNASGLPTLLRRPTLAAAAIDRAAHARAFDAVDAHVADVLPAILRQLGFNHVLDLGCGTAALLRELAAKDGAFVGWGIECNPAMFKAARARIRTAGLAGRVKVFEGDGRNPREQLPRKVLTQVRNITACQFANEMFRGGTVQAEKWLRRIRRLFPGKVLVVCDYYGRLGMRASTIHRETLLHDFAQIISGQGVPPPNASAWHAVYQAAGCRLLSVIEDKNTTRFVHIVKL
jgi:SAM-dependent methyltransferase